jgi:hypothetical protein
MNDPEHDWVKEGLLIEGLQDWSSLEGVHQAFKSRNTDAPRPVHEVQERTLSMIRELVSEGLFVLGVPTGRKETRFAPWDLPLEAAMAKIEDAYVNHFDDRWGWTTFVWLNPTEKGKKLALELWHADEPDP